MNNFEENLKRLEGLAQDIRRPDISLEDALKDFEEGIKLAKGMEKELDAIESKVQILMNAPVMEDDNASSEAESGSPKKSAKQKPVNSPVLDLFSESSDINGTRNA